MDSVVNKQIMPFSVAMSVYHKDDPKNFDIALESITLKQTVKPSEIVLVVDGFVSDEINLVIQKYQEIFPMKVIRLEKNSGLGNALKIAVENCSNELIARMDSDDVSVEDRFEQQLHLLSEDKSLDIVGGNISEFIGDESNIVAYRKVPKQDSEIKEYLKTRCPFNHVTVMYKRSSVLSAGGYKDLFFNEDYYLWIRMVQNNCKMANTGTVLVNVRIGQDMYRRRGGKEYFKSEKFLQNYMLENKMISKRIYFSNVLKRLIIQRLLPNRVRGWVFRKIARYNKP